MSKIRWSPIIEFFILFVTILFDGQFSNFIFTISKGKFYATSNIFLIFLIYVILKNSYLYNVVTSLILGFVYDSYFTGIIGIATLIYPLIALFIYHIRPIVHTNRLTRFFTLIIIITIFEVMKVVIIQITGLGDVQFLSFISKTLAPTLLLNIIIWVLLQIPLERIFIERKY
ncbi:rod shape-determining protein MreD [Floricoccus tropicus]|uniref:Rod shape-determining protein MreD n=1 Tax=Floricoccus tropicus TaxID=1859473 RepID=A0A1E8GQI6_9LACT|nr:rod shape-determining protein MreD [Floricoccus tropicus]OFI49758.1 rod shape-determining protein MreD [Floricoccus tropicus]